MQCRLLRLLGVEACSGLGPVAHSLYWQVGLPLWQTYRLLLVLLFSLPPSTGTASANPSGLGLISLSPCAGKEAQLASLEAVFFFFFFEPLECALVPALKPTALASDGNQTNLSIWGLFCKESISVCPLDLTWGSLAKQTFLCVNWNWLADLFLSVQILKHSGCWGLLPCCKKRFFWMEYISLNKHHSSLPHVYYRYYLHSSNSNSTVKVARLVSWC